jgi:hypothetical protein
LFFEVIDQFGQAALACGFHLGADDPQMAIFRYPGGCDSKKAKAARLLGRAEVGFVEHVASLFVGVDATCFVAWRTRRVPRPACALGL